MCLTSFLYQCIQVDDCAYSTGMAAICPSNGAKKIFAVFTTKGKAAQQHLFVLRCLGGVLLERLLRGGLVVHCPLSQYPLLRHQPVRLLLRVSS